MVEGRLSGRSGVIGSSFALLLGGSLGACASWLPESAKQDNHTLLYGEFYEANLSNDATRADHLARKLELCGRQLYVKDKGFLSALAQGKEHDANTSIGEMIALFTEDACEVAGAAPSPAAGGGSRRKTTTVPKAAARGAPEAGVFD